MSNAIKLLHHPIQRRWLEMVRTDSATMCFEWRDDGRAFKTWSLAHGWTIDARLDRIDRGGMYAPDNCQWVKAGTVSLVRRVVRMWHGV